MKNINKRRKCSYVPRLYAIQKGLNIENITHKGNRTIGTQKHNIKLSEPLGPYTFECSVIYIKALIRKSILYAAEAMYKVMESDYRALEIIEESVIQKVLQTKKTCPKHILYLEIGIRQGIRYNDRYYISCSIFFSKTKTA